MDKLKKEGLPLKLGWWEIKNEVMDLNTQFGEEEEEYRKLTS